jgi:hypothetical protein
MMRRRCYGLKKFLSRSFDIAYVVSVANRYMHDPHTRYLDDVNESWDVIRVVLEGEFYSLETYI